MTKKELIKLRKLMPKGYRKTLAEKFGISGSYITQIFRGEKTRPDVIDEAIEIAAAHKQTLADQKAKIKKL